MRKLLTICCTAAVLLGVGGCQTTPLGQLGRYLSSVESSKKLKANLETLKRTNACPNCYLQAANLSGAKLKGAKLQGADLRGAMIGKANLRGANLQNANLQGADFKGANLQEANLRGANLSKVNFWGANLSGANLLGTSLWGTKLQQANLRGANLQKTDLRATDLQGADLQGADLQGASLGDVNLKEANLRGADLQGADLQGADLQGADLLKANLRGAFLYRADLRGANLKGADLKGANLKGANLKEANLRDAKLDSEGLAMARAQGAIGLDSSGSDVAKVTPKMTPSSTTTEISNKLKANLQKLKSSNACNNCYLRGAYLREANLKGAFLQGADLREANLQGADLRGANLANVDLRRANLSRANLRGNYHWRIDLRGANLQGANLYRVKLWKANLQGANLSGANLQEASLEGSNLEGVNFKGANLRGASLRFDYLAMARAQGAIGLDTPGSNVAKAVPEKPKPAKQVAKASPPTKPTIAPAQAKDTTPPSIEIASAITVKEDSPTIRGRVSDNDRVVQVTVEGRTADLKADGTFSFSRYVPLGGTSVKIEAIDEWGNKSQKVVKLTREAVKTAAIRFDALNPTTFSAKGNPDAVALIIGIADYKRTASAKYADRDAEFFADYARRKLGVPRSNIKVLINDAADINDIIEATNVWLPSATKAGQSDVYVFFAGHGLGSEDGKEVYLLPYSGIPQVLDQTAIHRSKLFDTIASVKPRSVTVFLDTCYSGTSRTEDTLLASRPVILTPKEQGIPLGFTVFSAASMEQTAKLLPEAKHGLFSYYLMKGMEGPADRNKDRQITAGELHRYVLANVSRIQRNQTPELQGDAERVLVRW